MAPRDEVEEVLAGVWVDVLGVPRIRVHDNFFDLGGDSMLTIQVRGALRAAGWIWTSPASCALRPSPPSRAEWSPSSAGLATSLAAAAFELLSESERSGLPPGIVEAYPCTQMQASMVAAAGTSEDPTLYHDAFDFTVGLPLDRSRLRTALDDLTRRHPVLRTSFDFTRSSRPLQLVHATATIELHTGEEAGPRHPGYGLRTAWSVSELSRPFELGECPLLRMAAREPERPIRESDIDTAVVDSLKALDPERPIREAYKIVICEPGFAGVHCVRAARNCLRGTVQTV